MAPRTLRRSAQDRRSIATGNFASRNGAATVSELAGYETGARSLTVAALLRQAGLQLGHAILTRDFLCTVPYD
jgi:hypothetical protein